MVMQAIEKYRMLQANDGILIGFSGGADSVCLLHFLTILREKLNLRLFAVHIHHGLRGNEADADAEFCAELCQKLDVEYEIVYADVADLSKKGKISIEATGRKIRYDTFRKIADRKGLQGIAVGHHQNDVAETVLLQVLRGTGSIKGILPVNNGIIRPLLDVSRKQIEEYCNVNLLPFRVDLTNTESKFARNKIRLEYLPKLSEDFNPQIVKTLAKLAEISRTEQNLLDEMAQNVDDHKLPLRRRRIRHEIENIKGDLENITFEHIEAILDLQDGETGRQINLPDGLVARNVYGKIEITKPDKPLKLSYHLPIGHKIYAEEIDTWFYLGKDELKVDFDGRFEMRIRRDVVDEVMVRTRLNGDKITLSGGTKKMKDYFIDKKIPRHERDRAVFVAVSDEIITMVDGVFSEKYATKSDDNLVLCIWKSSDVIASYTHNDNE